MKGYYIINIFPYFSPRDFVILSAIASSCRFRLFSTANYTIFAGSVESAILISDIKEELFLR